MVGPGYLSPGHRQPAGHKGHLIRPTAPLWCERLSGPFDSLLLSQQEVVGDNWHRISLLTSGRLCGLKWQRSPEESGEQIRGRGLMREELGGAAAIYRSWETGEEIAISEWCAVLPRDVAPTYLSHFSLTDQRLAFLKITWAQGWAHALMPCFYLVFGQMINVFQDPPSTKCVAVPLFVED